MGGGGSKAAPPSPPARPSLTRHEEAQLQAKRQRDRCNKAERRLDHEISLCLSRAEAAKARGEKEVALRFLKLKKLKETRRAELGQQQYNLEVLVAKMEQARSDVEVFRAMEAGAEAIKAVQAELPIERAEAIMEGTADALAYADELDAVFRRDVVGAGAGAMEDLEDELDRLTGPVMMETTAASASSVAVAGSSRRGEAAAAATGTGEMGGGRDGEGRGPFQAHTISPPNPPTPAADPGFTFDMPMPPTEAQRAAAAEPRRAASPGRRRVAVPS
jgi:charged multivesicular body protein 6